MTGAWLGAALGAVGGVGLWLVVMRIAALRGGHFEARVLRQLQDIPGLDQRPVPEPAGPMSLLFGPLLSGAASRLERIVGGAASVQRRIERAGLDMTVHEFRIHQVVWGCVGFVATAALALLVALRSPDRVLPLAILALPAGVAGVLLRENRLTGQVRAHEAQVLAELPALAELLALSVAAGEGPVAALERVVARPAGVLVGSEAR